MIIFVITVTFDKVIVESFFASIHIILANVERVWQLPIAIVIGIFSDQPFCVLKNQWCT